MTSKQTKQFSEGNHTAENAKEQPNKQPAKVAKSIELNSDEKRLLQAGEDYYINESGLWVFTAEYHLRRGYCCKNDCLHCPYNHPLSK